ncbi:MAG: YhbY family RNA-binding protein [Fervidicoccaceae archaeon]|nr:YhbY family RNA-binding protein [Fervidicoccaceae archaeon]
MRIHQEEGIQTQRCGETSKEKITEKIHRRADVNIGKKGVTQEVIDEIKKRLEKEGLLKIKINKNIYVQEGISIDEFARILAQKTDSEIIDIRGRTIIIAKRK